MEIDNLGKWSIQAGTVLLALGWQWVLTRRWGGVRGRVAAAVSPPTSAPPRLSGGRLTYLHCCTRQRGTYGAGPALQSVWAVVLCWQKARVGAGGRGKRWRPERGFLARAASGQTAACVS